MHVLPATTYPGKRPKEWGGMRRSEEYSLGRDHFCDPSSIEEGLGEELKRKRERERTLSGVVIGAACTAEG